MDPLKEDLFIEDHFREDPYREDPRREDPPQRILTERIPHRGSSQRGSPQRIPSNMINKERQSEQHKFDLRYGYHLTILHREKGTRSRYLLFTCIGFLEYKAAAFFAFARRSSSYFLATASDFIYSKRENVNT